MMSRRAFAGLGGAGLLLKAMPVLPQYVDVWAYLQKPFVRGLTSNLFDIRAFKYARIDTNWMAR